MFGNLSSRWRCVNTSIRMGPGLKLGFPGLNGCFCVNILFLRFGILNSGWDDSLNDMPWEMSGGFLYVNEKWIVKR